VSSPKIIVPDVRGKPIREWEEDTLDRFLKMFEELADERLAEQLKARNRLN
jgi:hypothetical protein